MLGFEVVKTVSENDKLRRESWRAPKLGCLELRRIALAKPPDGKPVLVDDYQVTEVRLGEPDDALFRVPPNYKESSPSQVWIALASRYPNAAAAPPEAAVEDKTYHEARHRAGLE